MLYPIDHWNVECVVKDFGGKVVASRTRPNLLEAHQVEDFVTWAEKRGETCTVISVRVWYSHRLSYHQRHLRR